MPLHRFARKVITADISDSVFAVARKLRDERVGCVVVTREGRPMGIVTDRDLVVRVLAAEADPSRMTAADVVTYDPHVLTLQDDIETAARSMREHAVRRLPIIDSAGKVAGIVTSDDLAILLGQELADVCSSIGDNIDSSESR